MFDTTAARRLRVLTVERRLTYVVSGGVTITAKNKINSVTRSRGNSFLMKKRAGHTRKRADATTAPLGSRPCGLPMGGGGNSRG